jgi:hypothetical protein
MNVLIVSEGKHEGDGALSALVSGLIGCPIKTEFRTIRDAVFHRFHGKGQGLFKKAVSALRHAQEHGYDALVLVIDQDRDPRRREQLDKAQEHRACSNVPRALGIAIESFDAWILADEKALSTILKAAIKRQPDPERTPHPKQCCQRLRDESGSSLPLSQMYREVCEQADLRLLATRCPIGFGTFAKRVRALGSGLDDHSSTN